MASYNGLRENGLNSQDKTGIAGAHRRLGAGHQGLRLRQEAREKIEEELAGGNNNYNSYSNIKYFQAPFD